MLASQICQSSLTPFCLLSGEKGLSLSIITVLGSLGLQELDELVEDGSKRGPQKGTDPVDPVSRAKVERDQVGAESPGRVQRTTGVVDSGQPIILESV